MHLSLLCGITVEKRVKEEEGTVMQTNYFNGDKDKVQRLLERIISVLFYCLYSIVLVSYCLY